MSGTSPGESLLALDIGGATTRAWLFEDQAGQYRLSGFGSAPSSWMPPYEDVSAGTWAAINQIERQVNRQLVDQTTGRLIIPTLSVGAGADRLQLTISGGPPLKAIALGLAGSASLDLAAELVHSVLGPPLDAIGAADPRSLDEQLAALLSARADILVSAGGFEGGAEAGMIRMADLAEAVCRLSPPGQRPDVLYCGNHALDAHFLERLRRSTRLAVAPNILPREGEPDLLPAVERLSRLVCDILTSRLPGMTSLAQQTEMVPAMANLGLQRMLNWLGAQSAPDRPAMYIDLGASQVTFSAAGPRDRFTRVYPGLGITQGYGLALEEDMLPRVRAWLMREIALSDLRDALWNRHFHPEALPLTAAGLEIDQAVIRELLRLGIERLQKDEPGWRVMGEPLIVSGSALGGSPTPQNALLVLLDGLQPLGATTIYLDSLGILPALGTAARLNPLLSVQVLEHDGPACLAWVLSPVWPFAGGWLRLGVKPSAGAEHVLDIRPGGLMRLPVNPGQTADVRLLDMSAGTQLDARLEAGPLRITAGLAGAWVDARGRPKMAAWREQLGL